MCRLALAAMLVSLAAKAEPLARGEVVILDLQALPSINAAPFSDEVRAAAERVYPRIRLMSRDNMQAIAQNKGLSLGACDPAACVALGRSLGADTLIEGDLTRDGARLHVSLRMHDTASGRMIGTSQASGSTPQELAEPAVHDLILPQEAPPPVAQQPAPQYTPQYAPAPAAGSLGMMSKAPMSRAPVGTAMHICDYRGTWAFCDAGGAITENAFVERYRSATGSHDLDHDVQPRSSGVGPGLLIGFGLAGAIGAEVGMKCTTADISSNNCFGNNTDALTNTGAAIFIPSMLAVVGGVMWGVFAVMNADGSPSDHSMSQSTARTAVDAYNHTAK